MINIAYKPGALEKIMEFNAKKRASYDLLKKFAKKYDVSGNTILDVGIHGDVWPGGHKFLFKDALYDTADIDKHVQPTHVIDIRDIPFEDGIYDMIIVHSVIEHVLERRPEAYEELYRILKPGGLLIYVIPIYMEREVEAASFVDMAEFRETHEGVDYKITKLPDDTYFIEVRK